MEGWKELAASGQFKYIYARWEVVDLPMCKSLRSIAIRIASASVLMIGCSMCSACGSVSTAGDRAVGPELEGNESAIVQHALQSNWPVCNEGMHIKFKVPGTDQIQNE